MQRAQRGGVLLEDVMEGEVGLSAMWLVQRQPR